MLTCIMCSAPVVEPIHVGDLMGFRADDVVCSVECEDSAVYESHAANVDGESCRCNTCWRAARREAHAAIARHKGPRPEMTLIGEFFAAAEE